MPYFVKFRALSSATILLGLLGCQSIQPIERPVVPTSDWQHGSDQTATPINAHWWQSFASPQLTDLIHTAMLNNPDLNIASERVRQAELQMKMAGATLFPSFNISGGAGGSRTRGDGESWQQGESSRLALGVSYEVDLWGRASANLGAARAGFEGSRYDQSAAQLSISAAVASSWFQWLALQQRISTAEENIRIAERVQHIVEVRHRNGVATAADLARQQTNLLSQQGALLPLQLQARQTQAALTLLVGEAPQTLALQAEFLTDLALPSIAAGVPTDIISRRPDLASAEAQLQAADANVAAARAALLPGVQLSASAARSSNALLSLTNPVDSASWGLSLVQSLFDGGRLRNQVKLSESQRITLVEQYRKAIYTALIEVDDALDRREVTALQEQHQEQIIVQAERTLRLTELRYREGSDDLISLLEAQRSVFQARDQQVQQRLGRLNAAVDLYKALGGGWKVDETAEKANL